MLFVLFLLEMLNVLLPTAFQPNTYLVQLFAGPPNTQNVVQA